MPIYEFFCANCGVFERWRTLSEASQPMYCPQCKTIVRRVYSAPGLVRTPPSLAHARERSEKSAYEPAVVRRSHEGGEEQPQTSQWQHSHSHPWSLGHSH
jgi:putative FmdB family regulatory protein